MLEAVQSCSLLDDVFHEDPATIDLEAYVARRTGKEAALFVLSGTMGNQLALRSLLTQPPHSVVCDYRSHIFTCEAGGYVKAESLSPQNKELTCLIVHVLLQVLNFSLLFPRMADT